METYFVLHNDEDKITAESMSAKELTNRLNDDYYGKPVFLKDREEKDDYWGGSLAIIKGKLIIPKATQKAVEWIVD